MNFDVRQDHEQVVRSSTWFNIIPKRGPLPIQLCVGRGPFSFNPVRFSDTYPVVHNGIFIFCLLHIYSTNIARVIPSASSVRWSLFPLPAIGNGSSTEWIRKYIPFCKGRGIICLIVCLNSSAKVSCVLSCYIIYRRKGKATAQHIKVTIVDDCI